MGAFLSYARGRGRDVADLPAAAESSKRPRLALGCMDERPQMIPGLPDEIALQIVSRVPRGCHAAMKAVCKTWHEVLAGDEIFELRRELGLTEEWLYVLVKDEQERLAWYVLDPLEGQWRRLPSMPQMARDDEARDPTSSGRGWWTALGSSSLRLSGLFKGWFRRKDLLDRTPFCGCSAGAISGCLFVLGGFSKACAMKCVWRYDPRTNEWTEAASMGTARAYCKTGLLNNRLYAVGGVNRGRGGLTPLQSAEVYEPATDSWTAIPNMPFSRAQVLPTAFLADMLKPIATGMAAFKGKLCVPQSLYSWPFFVDVGGEVYDPVSHLWGEMPQGMGEGWPARQAGTKLSVVVNGRLYALDPTSAMDGSKIKMYDSEQDTWRVVLKKVPILLDGTDSECPYLLAGFREKLHVITKDNHERVTVLRADFTEPAANGTNGPDTEDDGWKTIATKFFGTVDLVTCQVLDV
ncbi:hypothetical protein MPTK1_1g11590 [Marchantia polymorpha subsp. ruderalis]|uniref:F-box domain-containing protein n=2 Tax=Marchantia polymorpha TaxID=3197 RepID=A0AAF6AP23_MARPO|nr:hypothetical protein MARPO_0014s0067 [Marchantia polymorpha]BBM98193.1 hypothetical protein Mp_1g11590 [Marchantia polymorpha subsp. ruderalis]|eukprot:PTQ45527.1 hypothetical protein MARPO_0014s0067 [Marchantia polymorpha]